MPKPVVLIAEELSPATIDALGPDFDVRNVDGTDRPALLVGAEREEMVEVVNTFTRRCASAPDCQADSHLGLSERWSDFRMADSLELERRFVAARS